MRREDENAAEARPVAARLAALPEAERYAFLRELSDNALAAMPYLWRLWGHPGHQLAPGDRALPPAHCR
ncbi:MAG: hypothetical protein AAF968_07035 [Pseudomonadota bacterium]